MMKNPLTPTNIQFPPGMVFHINICNSGVIYSCLADPYFCTSAVEYVLNVK